MKNLIVSVSFRNGADEITAIGEAKALAVALKETMIIAGLSYNLVIRPDSNVADLHEIVRLNNKLNK